jgi:hypothetical protein
MCALTLALVACTIAFSVLNRAGAGGLIFFIPLMSYVAVGGLVASRRSRNPVGWLFLVTAVCFALQSLAIEYATYGLLTDPGSLPAARAMAWLQTWIWVPGVMSLLIFLPLYFPDGRLVSPRWRWVVGFALFVVILMAIHDAFVPGDTRDAGLVNPLSVEALRPALDFLGSVTFPLYFAILFASAASLVVRFRRSAGEERQQIKWLAYAATAIPIWFLVNRPIEAAFPLLFVVVENLMFAGFPVVVGIAILRYRLYDIDFVINRTLVYGALTVMLVAVYLGGVVFLQAVFRYLTGQGSQLAIVASTLVIAALFNPLRRRIQAFIDRRFYRRKYDAAKTLGEFSATLREEVELDALAGRLVSVVRETMQPEHASLWLRPARTIEDRAEERRG